MTYEPVFPAELQPIALALLRAVPDAGRSRASQGFKVIVQGEVLSAPRRIYWLPTELRELLTTSTDETRALVLSLGTRHWDGYVREECLRQLVAFDQPWIIPFIIELLGEYVIEIVDFIAITLPHLDAEQFFDFTLHNPTFMATTRRRATSYWNCYYRDRFQTLESYPAIRVLDVIERINR